MISVVIPVFNNINITEALFSNISENIIKPTEIIIVDDCGTDDYKGLVKKYSELNVRYIRNDTNIGVNASWNKGIENSIYTIISILNNDILINKYFFKKIVETMADETIGLCVPNTIRHKSFNDIDDKPDLTELEQREGWAFTIRKEIISTYGYIPNRIKYFYGDDYLFLSSKKMNYKNVKITNNTIFHYGGATIGNATKQKPLLTKDKHNWNILQFEENNG